MSKNPNKSTKKEDNEKEKLRKTGSQNPVKNEQEYLKIRTSAPSQLPSEGKYLWTKIVKNLNLVDGLTKVDEPNLELFCANYALYRQALEEVKEHGVIFSTESGFKKNPAVGVMDTASKTMRSLSTALGFDYTFREKIIQEEDEEMENDELEVFKF
ncbi:phage terminase small subunit P27 family [Melissococcus plutonius]|uniref:phage terminase small subunit P27 family n=1 Tax=Melissococcus plutonius TaxID=33970 RepID=UPI00242C3B4E|nr:phage terminase small subunit P27 family [Melissococcus plutonius]